MDHEIGVSYVGAAEGVVAVPRDSLDPAVDALGIAELRVEVAVAHTGLPLHLPLRLKDLLVRNKRVGEQKLTILASMISS